MKAITLRGIPPEIGEKLRKNAEKRRISLNKAFIALLEEASGEKEKGKNKEAYHDLDHLCGLWNREEAGAFQGNLDPQRKVDGDLWKKSGF